VKVAVVAPPGTVTLAGTLAAALLDCSVITVPPDGDAPPRVTVPVELTPPITVVGLSVTEVSVCGLTVSKADAFPLDELAEMLT
jgi:hypothetical protein